MAVAIVMCLLSLNTGPGQPRGHALDLHPERSTFLSGGLSVLPLCGHIGNGTLDSLLRSGSSPQCKSSALAREAASMGRLLHQPLELISSKSSGWPRQGVQEEQAEQPTVPPTRMERSESCSAVSDSLRPHGLYSPWNSPGQNTGVGSLSLHRGSSQPRGQAQVSRIEGRFFTS